ncbi:MAG: DNA-binding response regulator [Porticoccaceae bacterium]|nr:DNA-binding response regulator [Porticoccaceae bacterium]
MSDPSNRLNGHPDKVRVLVVDDHDLIRMGLCRLLDSVPEALVVAQAASGEEALDQVRRDPPEVVLMDIRMPGMGGFEATRRILVSHPGVRVIVITAFNDDVHLNKLLKAGASGYITKSSDHSEISQALKVVMAGDIYVSPAIAQQMVVSGLKPGQESSPLGLLSERELQIAQMITSGHRAAEVAAVLCISPKTINTHKYRIYEKLGVSNDVELTLAAVRHGLVDPGEVL